MTTKHTSNEMMEKFATLACRLSPENLSCDGECSPSQTRQRHVSIMSQWKKLEAQYGVKVTLEEAEHYAYNS